MSPLTETKTRRIIRKKLWQTLSSETQAIAIYSAEIRVLKFLGRKLEPYMSILAEEIEHENVIHEFLRGASLGVPSSLRNKVDQYAGWLIGSALACLPSRYRNPAHVWAERQAALIYLDCARVMKQFPETAALEEALRHSAFQENEHAKRFASFTSGEKPGR